MALDNAQFISELSITDPLGGDPLSEGDDQIRTVKRATQQSFPNVDAQVTLSAAELNDVALKSAANVFSLVQVMPGIDADTTFTLRANVGVAAFTALIARTSGKVDLFHNALVRLSTQSSGRVEVRSDGDTDAEDRQIRFLHQDATLRGIVGFDASANLVLDNKINGGNVALFARNAGGTIFTILNGNADTLTTILGATGVDLRVGAGSENAVKAIVDGAVELYHNNIKTFATAAIGIVEIFSNLNTDTDFRRIDFKHQDGTLRALMGHTNATADFRIDNRIPGGNMVLLANDTGGTERNIIEGDPDGALSLHHAGTKTAETASLANGGLLVQDIGATNRKVGFRKPPRLTVAGNISTLQAHEGVVYEVTASGITVTVDVLEAETPITLINRAAGSITIAEGAGVSMEFHDGGGVFTTGNRTFAVSGVCQLWWLTTTTVIIWGNGLT